MVGRLEAGGRVAAAALLALGSLAPLEGPLVATPPAVASVADTSTTCATTVGTASTDPALAADAARALAVGYATTDCMPDAQLLAAAEARAAIPMDSNTPPQAAVGGVLAGRSSSGSAGVEGSGGLNGGGGGAIPPAVTPSPTATADAIPTPAETATPAPTETAGLPIPSGTSGTDGESNDGTSSGSNSDGSEGFDSLPSNQDQGNQDQGNQDQGNQDQGNQDPVDQPGTSLSRSPQSGDTVDCAELAAATATIEGTTNPADGTTTPADGSTSAASTHQWGTATAVEDFDGDLTNWGVYKGPGHDGNGCRSPSAMSVSDGVLSITGDANGVTGGMAWDLGRAKYGRWEARVKSPVADPSYNAVMLLWPDAENWPEGGEVDFMEIGDETRQKADFFLHYGADNSQLHGEVEIDATQWHNWAVEWSPDKITAYVDGKEWYSTTQVDALPPDSMHLTLQLDWFPKDGSVQPSTMQVDWVRYYAIPGVTVENLDTTSSTDAPPANITGGVEPEPVGTNAPVSTTPAGAETTASTSITAPESAAARNVSSGNGAGAGATPGAFE